MREYLREDRRSRIGGDRAAEEGSAAPLVRSITSELTGNEVKVEEDTDPVAYEENLQPSEVSPETRALARPGVGAVQFE